MKRYLEEVEGPSSEPTNLKEQLKKQKSLPSLQQESSEPSNSMNGGAAWAFHGK
jgi:hypothetical protein